LKSVIFVVNLLTFETIGMIFDGFKMLTVAEKLKKKTFLRRFVNPSPDIWPTFFHPMLATRVTRGRCYDHNFLRFLAHWEIVYFAQFVKNYSSSVNLRASFSLGNGYAYILTNNHLGCSLGDFFKKS
jgi:hypothetical protein